MSFCSSKCEHQTAEEKLQSIQNELIWGLAYRNYKKNEGRQPISPIPSPLNIPFELCRARMTLKPPKKPTITASLDEEEKEITREPYSGKKPPKKRKLSREKPTLLDRNVWSQNKYMDYLSLPNPKFYEEPKKKRHKKRCELEPCPPRFVQLAIPNKRRVYANWKDYADILPTEMLMRYDEILHTDQNLEPKEARYYYKKLDRQKRKEKRKKKRQEKLKRQAQQKDSDWLKELVELLTGDIVSYIQDEPLFALNYKQMLLSDGILERLDQTQMLKKPSRKTKNDYKKTVIEVSDKMAVWIDTLTRFVDVQAIDSTDDIPPVSISSLGEDEGETETYESTTTEEELDDDKWFEKVDGEEGVGLEDETEDAEAVAQSILKPGQGEGPAELDEILNGLDGDILEKLIQILSKCSDEFLDSLIEENQLPDITYRDVLDRLKELKKKLQPSEGEQSFLEQIMVDWAMQNDPENVNDEVLKKIHEVAAILEDMLAKKDAGRKSELGVDKGEGGADQEGGEGEEEAPPKEDDEKSGEGDDKLDEKSEEVLKEDEDATTAPTEEELGAEDKKEDEGEEGGDAADKEESGLDEELKAKDDEEAEEGEGKDESPEDELKDKDEEPSEVSDGQPTTTEDEDKDEPKEIDEDLKDEEIDEEEITTKEEEEPAGEDDTEPTKPSESETEQKPDETEEEKPEGVDGRPPEEPDRDVSDFEGTTIKGHKPPKVFEHSPDTVCCLSLKTWAVWLLEITKNANNWTQWMSCVIHKVREFASIVRGDVKESDGQVKVLKKAEWRKFISETEESVVAWRQYSAHVKDLSQSIVDSFHGKRVNCCPKCLQDHTITNVVLAHDTLQALTEAISCAAYWQRCLDNLADKACQLANTQRVDVSNPDLDRKSSESETDEAILEDVVEQTLSQGSGESVYEIEGFNDSDK